MVRLTVIVELSQKCHRASVPIDVSPRRLRGPFTATPRSDTWWEDDIDATERPYALSAPCGGFPMAIQQSPEVFEIQRQPIAFFYVDHFVLSEEDLPVSGLSTGIAQPRSNLRARLAWTIL